MSKKDPNLLQHNHDKGQSDRSEGKGYNVPNNAVLGLLNTKQENAQNQAYREGWKNTDQQKKK